MWISKQQRETELHAARAEGAAQIKAVVQFMIDKYERQLKATAPHTEGAMLVRQQLNALEDTMVFVNSKMGRL